MKTNILCDSSVSAFQLASHFMTSSSAFGSSDFESVSNIEDAPDSFKSIPEWRHNDFIEIIVTEKSFMEQVSSVIDHICCVVWYLLNL